MQFSLNRLNEVPLRYRVSAGICAGLVSIGGIGFAMLRHISAQQGFKQPTDLGIKAYAFSRCYPSTYQVPQQIRQVQVGNVTYYEILAKSLDPKSKIIATLHLRTEGDACAWLNRLQPTKRLAYLSKDVAVSFAEAHYRPMFEKCLNAARAFKISIPEVYCREDMEKGLSGLPNQQQILYTEELSALKLLGINPNKIKNYREEK